MGCWGLLGFSKNNRQGLVNVRGIWYHIISPIVGWCETLGHLPTPDHSGSFPHSLLFEDDHQTFNDIPASKPGMITKHLPKEVKSLPQENAKTVSHTASCARQQKPCCSTTPSTHSFTSRARLLMRRPTWRGNDTGNALAPQRNAMAGAAGVISMHSTNMSQLKLAF